MMLIVYLSTGCYRQSVVPGSKYVENYEKWSEWSFFTGLWVEEWQVLLFLEFMDG